VGKGEVKKKKKRKGNLEEKKRVYKAIDRSKKSSWRGKQGKGGHQTLMGKSTHTWA